MKNLKYGIEIEFAGISRETAAETVADFFGTEFFYGSGELDEREIIDSSHRIWKVVKDGSIDTNDTREQCELVSPVLTYEDMEVLIQIADLITKAGGIVNRSCGIHIHVDCCPAN